MKVYTSHWRANLPPTIQKVGVCRGQPRGYPAGYRMYSPGKPGIWFNSVSPERYVELYCKEVLSTINPETMFRRLEELSNGRDVALLCYEAPPFSITDPGMVGARHDTSNFCHRRLLAQHIENLVGGIEIPEYGTTEATVGIEAEQWLRDEMRKVQATI